jgi:lipoyl(octanoyl) transferase
MQEKQTVFFMDLGTMEYKQAWDYQESLLNKNLEIKRLPAEQENKEQGVLNEEGKGKNISSLPGAADSIEQQNKEQGVLNEEIETSNPKLSAGIGLPKGRLETGNYLLFVEHPPVYTLGKSGHIENVLINEAERKERGISFYQTNRGGDITFHGPGQVVGYPILDLEKFYTDIGRYLRELEEVIILTLAEYGIVAGRSQGETGVWIDALSPGKERKICAMGVRCSRWITMHGFALNVNADLGYFNHIIPCGIQNKKVTSIKEELGREVSVEDVKEKLKRNFEKVFDVIIVNHQNTFGR